MRKYEDTETDMDVCMRKRGEMRRNEMRGKEMTRGKKTSTGGRNTSATGVEGEWKAKQMRKRMREETGRQYRWMGVVPVPDNEGYAP
jgi:hypothetical protein